MSLFVSAGEQRVNYSVCEVPSFSDSLSSGNGCPG